MRGQRPTRPLIERRMVVDNLAPLPDSVLAAICTRRLAKHAGLPLDQMRAEAGTWQRTPWKHWLGREAAA